MKNIRKGELITQILSELAPDENGYRPNSVMLGNIIELLFCKIATDVGWGRDVVLRDLCSFTFILKKARRGHIPGVAGSSLEIPEQVVLKFKPGRRMRECMGRLTVSAAKKILKKKKRNHV